MTGVEDMLGASLLQWIDTYGHLVLVVIMLFEGTVTSFIAGALSAVGVFNPFLVIAAFLVARLIADSVLLFLARHASDYLRRFSVARGVIDKIRIDSSNRGELSLFIERHFGWSLFIAQIVPVALIHTMLIIAAGTMKMNVRKVYIKLLIVQPILSASVVGLGYFFGNALQDPEKTINIIGLVISSLIIIGFIYGKFGHSWVLERTKLRFLVGK